MLRVLIVDDDVAVAGIHRQFVDDRPEFEAIGEAHTGAEALAAVRALQPDLMLLDIYLPDMSGLDVLRRIREPDEAGVDVVVITAAREVDTVRAAMAGGVLHYLIKPFTRADLNARLSDYLAHRRLVRESAAGPLDQTRVDQLLGIDAGTSSPTTRPRVAGPSARLPKGLSSATMTLVSQALRASPAEMSAEDIAAKIGMSRVAARRYLEHLVAVGSAQVQPRFGRAGRPRNLYRWSGPS